jgi:DNA primase
MTVALSTSERSPGTYTYNFRELKRDASFETVCTHYHIVLVGRGDQRSALCPFHNETKPSLKINLGKKIFHCFGCEAKGNILDFVARMEHETNLAKAAEALARICAIPATATTGTRTVAASVKSLPPEQTVSVETPVNRVVNPPLTFTLKLQSNHSYLDARGVTPADREAFGLGYCDRGMMKGRICIPVHNERGELVAYAGRWPSDEGWPDGEDRYKLPPKFQKTRVLFNLHRITDASHVVLVEGYWSIFRLHTLGVPVVSSMGWSVSEEQIALLRDRGTRFLTLLTDGDETGRRARERLLPLLANMFFVRSPELPLGTKPDSINESELLELVRL